MTTWTFEAGGQTVTVDAADRLGAMGQANRLLGAGTSRLPQGAWMERGPTSFYWAAGNFFD